MDRIRLTKEFAFEMAHTLTGYDGACREIHGHSYRLFVTVAGLPEADPHSPKYGMVMDFGALKKIVSEEIVGRLDHSLVLRDAPENRELIGVLKRHFSNVHAVDYQPTCENMVIRFAEIIRRRLPAGIDLHSLRLHETATSFAEWFAQDNP